MERIKKSTCTHTNCILLKGPVQFSFSLPPEDVKIKYFCQPLEKQGTQNKNLGEKKEKIKTGCEVKEQHWAELTTILQRIYLSIVDHRFVDC
jgi:hypothetical protein